MTEPLGAIGSLGMSIYSSDSTYYGSKLVTALRHFSSLCGVQKELFLVKLYLMRLPVIARDMNVAHNTA
ncbi:MAG: hypothetical protein ACJA1F_001980 [Paracoccaceae bacterium]|jgi:hypothetical protein